ncbi:hypothetical protein C6496_09485 [Candidatus Poribacteria bacterium]|nr:MAG: hypothetical protein C6496_09485 [Candidatus Poribacteria bacterium]
MNENISAALETLKMETLLVLYRNYKRGGKHLGIKRVRELMNIPPTPFANHPNDMVCHFLCFLKTADLASYEKPNKWDITLNGINLIENGDVK